MKIADSRIKPTFELESAEHQLGWRPIAGVDEAGRGPWAGPVVAAAVILDPDKIPANIDDSKALDEESRAYLYNRIMKVAIVAVGVAEVDRIDRDNILAATLWAMAQAISQLKEIPKLVLVDGNKAPRVAMTTRTIVKGDSKCLSIAAASIIAKVTRDRIMTQLARDYPGYGF
nr:ribonuclease HII [Hyphomicrobium sp.]